MSQFRLIATAETPQEIADALNRRRQELSLSMNDIDAIIGFAERYSSKIFAANYNKSLGKLSLQAMLSALGCKLCVVADENALPPITRRAIRERTLSSCRIETPQRHPRPDAA